VVIFDEAQQVKICFSWRCFFRTVVFTTQIRVVKTLFDEPSIGNSRILTTFSLSHPYPLYAPAIAVGAIPCGYVRSFVRARFEHRKQVSRLKN